MKNKPRYKSIHYKKKGTTGKGILILANDTKVSETKMKKFKMSFKEIIDLSTFVILISSFFILFITFILAYLHPSKAVTLHINTYNEANIELFVLCIGLILVLSFVRTLIKEDITKN